MEIYVEYLRFIRVYLSIRIYGAQNFGQMFFSCEIFTSTKMLMANVAGNSLKILQMFCFQKSTKFC